MGCLFFSLWLIELNTAPVDTVFYYSFTLSLYPKGIQVFFNVFQRRTQQQLFGSSSGKLSVD